MKKRSVFFALLFAVLVLFIYLAGQPYGVKFSRDCWYDYETNSIFNNGGDSIDIAPEIVDFVYNKNFVAVKQKPNSTYSFYYMYDFPENFSRESYKNGLDEIYYWLISLKEKKVYGPFLFEEFNSLCEEKNVRLEFKKRGTKEK